MKFSHRRRQTRTVKFLCAGSVREVPHVDWLRDHAHADCQWRTPSWNCSWHCMVDFLHACHCGERSSSQRHKTVLSACCVTIILLASISSLIPKLFGFQCFVPACLVNNCYYKSVQFLSQFTLLIAWCVLNVLGTGLM